MRNKKLTLVITFKTTEMAIKMEKGMQAIGAPGRIIPVPKAITASCGLAYITEPEHEAWMMEKMKELQIEADEIVTMMV